MIVNNAAELQALILEAQERGWVLEVGNPYHEPAGKSTGGQFAHAPSSVRIATGDGDIIDAYKSIEDVYGGTLNKAGFDLTFSTVEGVVNTHIKANSLTPKQVEKALENMKELVEKNPISVRVPLGLAEKVLDDGRLKTQFETGKSKGRFDPNYRAMQEAGGAFVPLEIAKELRPVYGYFNTPGHQAKFYGDVELQLKDSVKSRTTITAGDSLGAFGYEIMASPLKAISKHSMDSWVKEISKGQFARMGFIEAQIHGGVKMSDVAKVVFHPKNGRTSAIMDVFRYYQEHGFLVEWGEDE